MVDHLLPDDAGGGGGNLNSWSTLAQQARGAGVAPSGTEDAAASRIRDTTTQSYELYKQEVLKKQQRVCIFYKSKIK